MRRHQTRLLAFLQQMSGLEQSKVEDLVQETFIKAYVNLENFDYSKYNSDKAFGTWLFTIGRRLLLNELRKSNRDKLVFFSASQTTETQNNNIPDNSESFERSYEQSEEQKYLWSKIRCVLTEPQWAALWLQYVEDYSIEEIAKALNKKKQGVKALIHRGKRVLQNHPEIFGR